MTDQVVIKRFFSNNYLVIINLWLIFGSSINLFKDKVVGADFSQKR